MALPGVGDDGRVLVLLASSEGRPHGGTLSIVPGRLHEDVPNAGVARLGDGPETPSVSRGVLTGHEPQIGHELARGLKAPDVPELGSQYHRSLGREAAEGTDAIHAGL